MPRIDLVVSGINDGANVGTNICYSGTVAAAIEAAFHRIPSVAISAALEDDMDFELSVRYGIKILQSILPLDIGDIININIPPLKEILPKGVKIEPQSIEGFDEVYISSVDSSGKKTYQIQAGPHRNEKDDNDTNALMDNYITLTALHFDMTEYDRNEKIKHKLKGINLTGENNDC
jgi:5'-nucleotidase